MTQQYITQADAVALAKKVGSIYEADKIQALCIAAIQHYIDQRAKEFPVLPEHVYMAGARWYGFNELQVWGDRRAAQALEEAEKRMLAKAAELGIYNHHATKALVEALKGK